MSATVNYPIESVENASRVLLMLRTQRVLRVSAVASELEIARSSAHRLLNTLLSLGLLRQDPTTRTYGPGAQLIQIGVAVIGATDLRAEARPVIEKLSHQVGETVHLIVLDGSSIVFLDGVEGRHAVRAAVRAGDRAPAHASAAGKVLLAPLTSAQLQERYPGSRLKGGTDSAIGSRRALERELKQVREDGYAMNKGESEFGLHAISAPIYDSAGKVRAALSISGPSERLTVSKLVQLTSVIHAAAADVGTGVS